MLRPFEQLVEAPDAVLKGCHLGEAQAGAGGEFANAGGEALFGDVDAHALSCDLFHSMSG